MDNERNQIEIYFDWWLSEMIANGYIKNSYREPETIVVSEPIEYGRIKRYKRKENTVEAFNLFPAIRYTYDELIVWTSKAEYLFYEIVNAQSVFQFGKPLFVAHKKEIDGVIEVVSYVDVKPTTSAQQKGAKVTSAISFPIKKRLCWENHGIYINKVVPIPMAGTGYSSALFILSFTPERFLLTDGGKRRRKIKWEDKLCNLHGYVKKKQDFIYNLLDRTSN